MWKPQEFFWQNCYRISPSIYLFGVLRRFQHCTGHITTSIWKGRENQYIQFIRVLYCKLPTNSKQLPAFPLEAVPGTEPRPQRWEVRVLPLCHRGPSNFPIQKPQLIVQLMPSFIEIIYVFKLLQIHCSCDKAWS